MYHPEFDDLCHEVAGKLSELRRLTMETVVLTDDQEALLAEITRLLRLVDAASSQQLHSLLGDTAVEDSAFLAELRDELPRLATPAKPLLPSPLHPPTPSSPKGKEGEPEGVVREIHPLPLGEGSAERGTSEDGGEVISVGFRERPVPRGLLEEIYWDIQPVYKGDTRLLLAHDTDWHFCLIVTDETGQTALLFDTDEARAAYLGEVYREALDRPKSDKELSTLEKRLGLGDDSKEDDEPDAPVPAPLFPSTPVLAGGNARRLEETIEESEQ